MEEKPVNILMNFHGWSRRYAPSDNFNQFSSNDSLSSTVEQDLELVDHLTSVLGGIVHSVTASRLLTGVSLSKSLEA